MAILTVISIGIFISTHSLRSNPSTHMFGWEEMSKPEADVFSVWLPFPIRFRLIDSPRGRICTAYEGNDYPREWSLPPLETVRIAYEDSVHYAVDTPRGRAEWNSTLPSGGATVRLGPRGREFTVSLFHELRCLDVIRDALVGILTDADGDARPDGAGTLARHCMNYVRQMVQCRADLRLESIRVPVGAKKAVSDVSHTCRDWSAVHAAAEENYATFVGRERDIRDPVV